MKKHKSSIINHKSITIGWLYPELMNTYGDRGNLITLKKRCEWRDIKTNLKFLDLDFSEKDLNSCDIILMGGAQDQQQSIVHKDLKKHLTSLSKLIEKGIPGLYVCGAYQLLGKYYKESNGKIIHGLGIFDLYTQNPGPDKPRLIGNISIEPIVPIHNSELKLHDSTIIGFENHGGRTYLGKNLKPFGKIIKGYGNNGDGFEGAIYKNSFGTYLHGPILPKNPQFADHLIQKALEIKYDFTELMPIDDDIEWKAHNHLIKKLDL